MSSRSHAIFCDSGETADSEEGEEEQGQGEGEGGESEEEEVVSPEFVVFLEA